MAEGGGGGTAVVVVLAVCAAAGMATGTGGDRVRAASDGAPDQPQFVSVDNARSFDGSLHLSTSACDGTGASQLRYEVVDGAGGRVAQVTRDVEPADRRQRATIGRGLPEGDYRVTVTCLQSGQPVGDFRTTSARVVPAGSGDAAGGSGASGAGRSPAGYPLPATGR